MQGRRSTVAKGAVPSMSWKRGGKGAAVPLLCRLLIEILSQFPLTFVPVSSLSDGASTFESPNFLFSSFLGRISSSNVENFLTISFHIFAIKALEEAYYLS